MSDLPTLQLLIDKFWESVPPAWRQTRSQIRRSAVEKFQMTEEQFQVLRRIRNGSVSVSALAEASQTSRSAVSKAVEALVRRGLVTRSQNPPDRRNLPLALTEEGQRVMDGSLRRDRALALRPFRPSHPRRNGVALAGPGNPAHSLRKP